jgi:hypothetical protein
MDNLFIGAVENGARTAYAPLKFGASLDTNAYNSMLWNLAANAKGGVRFHAISHECAC